MNNKQDKINKNKSNDKSYDKSYDKPADNSVDKPSDNSVDKLVDIPIDKPTESIKQTNEVVDQSSNKVKLSDKQNEEQQHMCKQFILDPLSVIIKLAIISHKPVGTKISICNNLVGIQENGIFQPIVRFMLQNTKEDLHFLYNPIELACKHFLSDTFTAKMPNIKHLFECALYGLSKLDQTYKSSPTIVLCLHYYSNLILNHINKPYNSKLFKPDTMSLLYTGLLVNKLTSKWTNVKLQMVLDLNEYLISNDNSEDNLNGLEMFMKDFDNKIQQAFLSLYITKLPVSLDTISI